ncbi:MAG: glycosyltransferase [Pseudomonadota bacterium]|jgi:glycosyltransferase involved in cell wall biosynthesis
MRVAFVTTNLRGGGAEKALLKLAHLLGAAGHDVHLVLLEHVVDHPPDGAFRLHALTPPGVEASKGLLGKYRASIKLRQLFARLNRDGPFDLVVSSLPFADEVTALARLPRHWCRIANTLSAEVAALARANRGKATRRLRRYRRLYARRNLIAVSEGVAQDLRQGMGLSEANITTIYNPFDPDAIRCLAQAQDEDIPDHPYVVHVGRFARQKRHDLLFDAWRRAGLPHKLVLLTAPAPELDRLISEHGLRDAVVVAGFRPNPYPWMRRAELLVLCSDHEGMPNVLVEALICGTRVVSTDCPSGPREVMRGGLARFLVPCGDAMALAKAMRAALAAPAPSAEEVIEPFLPIPVLRRYEALPRLWRAR